MMSSFLLDSERLKTGASREDRGFMDILLWEQIVSVVKINIR